MKNQCQFLDPKKNQVLITPDHFKDFFKNLNYYLLPKNKLKREFLIFIHLKIFRKLRIFFNLILSANFTLSNPKNYNYLIFDDIGSEIFKRLIPQNESYILTTRIENFKHIYLSRKIAFYLIKNFFKRSLKVNYLCALIEIIKPKVVITIIDNSADFYLISNIFEKKGIKFIAIQNAYRSRAVLNCFPYIQNYFTFSDYEVELIKKNQNKSPRLKSIGSINAATAKEYFKINKISFDEKTYDICLISEAHYFLNTEYPDVPDISENIGLVAKYTHQFCKKNRKKLIFSGRNDINALNKNVEKIFYENQLKGQKFEISFPNRKKFENYQNVIKSDLIIASHSTMLREAIAFKKKILWCNWVDQTEFPATGICKLDSKNYENFEIRVKKLLEMNYDEYLSEVKKYDLAYNSKIDTLKFLKNELK